MWFFVVVFFFSAMHVQPKLRGFVGPVCKKALLCITTAMGKGRNLKSFIHSSSDDAL